MTAVEFLKKENLPTDLLSGDDVNYAMIEFAKIQVEAALEEIEIQRCLYHYPRIEFINKSVLISNIK